VIDELVAEFLAESRCPGLAVAVCHQGGVVFAKGYGLRDLRWSHPVTTETLYPIASTTKAMTAALVAMLVDQRKVTWDAPIREYLPWLQLANEYVAAHVTLRDALTMRTGLPRHDWTWMGYWRSREELVRALRHLDFSAGFRERFQYNNLMVVLAGHVVEVVSGQSWERVIQSELLAPLKMDRTVAFRPRTGDVTGSYREDRHRNIVPSSWLSAETTGPSGGVLHSTILDMAKWVLFNLPATNPGAARPVSDANLAEIHKPQVLIGEDAVAPSPNAAYGMGWFVDSFCGHRRVAHAGLLDEVSSEIALIPDLELGVISFTNCGSTAPARVLNETVLGELFGIRSSSRLQSHLREYKKKISDLKASSASAPRVPCTKPSHRPEAYGGVYSHPGYGELEIRASDEKLKLHRGTEDGFVVPLEHWHFDAWVAEAEDQFGIYERSPFSRATPLRFETGSTGEVAAVIIQFEPTTQPIRFTRRLSH
jgi:CubicO group peptidase (beta-lactamase class C family)